MIQETVRIVGYEVSKTVFDIVVPLLAALVGTVMGGIITYFVTRSADNRRWQRERTEREMEYRREAITAALEWILPIQMSLNRIESLWAALQGESISEAHFYQNCRNLIAKISLSELSPKMTVILPSDIFEKILEILKVAKMLTPTEKFNGSHKEYVEWVESLFGKEGFRIKVKTLYNYLDQEHSGTFTTDE